MPVIPPRWCGAASEINMRHLQCIVFVLVFGLTSVAFAADGLIVVKSPYSAKVTMDRVEETIKQRGLNVFARRGGPRKSDSVLRWIAAH